MIVEWAAIWKAEAAEEDELGLIQSKKAVHIRIISVFYHPAFRFSKGITAPKLLPTFGVVALKLPPTFGATFL